MEPLLNNGDTYAEEVVDQKMLTWAASLGGRASDGHTDGVRCINREGCDKIVLKGQKALVVRNRRGRIRSVSCSVLCQRQYYVIARKRT